MDQIVGNLAGQIQQVESLVHHSPFVQGTWRGKGASPSIGDPAHRCTVTGFETFLLQCPIWTENSACI